MKQNKRIINKTNRLEEKNKNSSLDVVTEHLWLSHKDSQISLYNTPLTLITKLILNKIHS